MIGSKLSRALVSPTKVASILDWRKAVGSVMSLNITKDRIGIAVAEHPENIYESVTLDSISLTDTNEISKGPRNLGVSKKCISALEATVRRHNTCAFLVNWPLNEGRMGEQCGKVLGVLDSVANQSKSVITNKRPFTLCGVIGTNEAASSLPDEWGRAVVFTHAPEFEEGISYSSKSVLSNDNNRQSSAVAANILDQWINKNWEIDTKIGRATCPKEIKSDYFFSKQSVDEYTTDSACIQSALL